jgi:hypothetical protein
MRALTVRNPWAWAIVHGGKDVENRAQTWGYRGMLAIHAGAGWSREGELDLRCGRAYNAAAGQPPFVFGAIIGVANLIDVHRATEGCCVSQWADASYNGSKATHLVLTDRQALRQPVPAKGVLGLWQIGPQTERAVCEQLPAPAVPL